MLMPCISGIAADSLNAHLAATQESSLGYKYLLSELNVYGWLFLGIFFLRYFRLVVNAISFWTLSTVQLPLKPTFTADDVTVVVPSIVSSDILECLQSILRCQPAKILLVVPRLEVRRVLAIISKENLKGVHVLDVAILGKRKQMVRGISEVDTAITVFADDDVIWSPSYLAYLLTAFDDEEVGAAGTNQRVLRESGSVWNMLGIAYLERRNFNTFSMNRIDGGISTLSGRTSAFRTEILQTYSFIRWFIQDVSTVGRPHPQRPHWS